MVVLEVRGVLLLPFLEVNYLKTEASKRGIRGKR